MNKIKQFIEGERGKDVFVIIIVLLVGLASFELGRLSKASSGSGVKIEYGTESANVISATELYSNILQNDKMSQKTKNANGKVFFASSRGSKYYSIGCSAGKNIKQENRIYFAIKEEAERAGYELSNACR